MSAEEKEAAAVTTAETTYIASIPVQIPQNVVQMQAATQSQQTIVPQSASQVQSQGMSQATGMAQVMTQGPQSSQSPHGVGVPVSMAQQSPQYYVQASIASAMQGPPAIAPAPGPQTSTTTVSALHQPLQHHLSHQSLSHPGVSQSPMPQDAFPFQYQQQVQVIQGSLPGGPYLQPLYSNAQGQLLMPIQHHGINTQLQQGTINPLNSSIQVITASGKPFQGQIGPHMLTSTGGKPGVLQSGQASYNHAGNPNSGGQTVLIGQLGGQLGVISSQNPNIMNAQNTGQKPGDMHKVNNMQTFQQGIAWATPGSIHSPTILTQNQPIYIRGPQPGQENLYIQSAPQQQTMIPPNSMVSSIAAMPAGNQQNKQRTGMEMQANIQPKVSMRPHTILPSMTTTQIRPGSSVSTQTASGQTSAQSQMGNHRAQGKVRGKNAAHRTSPAINSQHQISMGQVMQNQPTTTISISGAQNMNQLTPTLSTSMHTLTATVAASVPKQISQAPSAETFNTMTQSKPGAPIHPPTAPIRPSTPGNRMAKGSPSTSPMMSSSHVTVPTSLLTTMCAPMPISTQTTMSQVPIVPSTRPNDIAVVTSSNGSHLAQTASFTSSTPNITFSSCEAIYTQPGKLTTTVSSQPVTTTTTSRLHDVSSNNTENIVNSSSAQQEAAGQQMGINHVLPFPFSSSITCSASSITTTNVEVSGNVTNCVASLPNGKLPSSEKSVVNSNGPPKAMVKPQVMTHVIEGFVIHEASEPFPVNRSSLLTDLNKVRSSNASNTATVLPQGSLGIEKEEDSEYSKCEVCGKTDLRSKFKKKRFCSSNCAAKRVNKAGTPKRGVEAFKGSEEPSPKRFKEISKAENENDDYTQEDYGNSTGNNTNVAESSHDEQDSLKTQKVDILKWTVRDVVEFIRNLPGCQDYAEDFAIQEIDGQALMLLKADHLMTAMSMKLGPALKICNKIENMRGEKKEA